MPAGKADEAAGRQPGSGDNGIYPSIYYDLIARLDEGGKNLSAPLTHGAFYRKWIGAAAMEGRKQKKNLSSGTLRSMIGDAVNYKRVLAVLAVLTAVVSVLTIWNASKLQKAINQRTRTYVADVSLQLASDIDFRLKKNILDLEILEDSLIQLENLGDIPSLDAFLDRKAEILGFNSIVVIHPGGKFYGTAAIPGDIYQMPGIQDPLQGKNGVTFLDRQSILYSIPIHKDKEGVGALAGVRDR